LFVPFSVIFGFLGLLLLQNGVMSIRMRNRIAQEFDRSPGQRRRRTIAALVALGAGASMILAAALVWRYWPIALVLGIWPVVLFALLYAAGGVKIISTLSSGDGQPNS